MLPSMSALTFETLSAELTQALAEQSTTPPKTIARCTLGRDKVMVLVEYPLDSASAETSAIKTLDWLEQHLRTQFDTTGLPDEAADLSEETEEVAVQLYLKHFSEAKPFTMRSFTWKVDDGFSDLFGESTALPLETIATSTAAHTAIEAADEADEIATDADSPKASTEPDEVAVIDLAEGYKAEGHEAEGDEAEGHETAKDLAANHEAVAYSDEPLNSFLVAPGEVVGLPDGEEERVLLELDEDHLTLDLDDDDTEAAIDADLGAALGTELEPDLRLGTAVDADLEADLGTAVDADLEADLGTAIDTDSEDVDSEDTDSEDAELGFEPDTEPQLELSDSPSLDLGLDLDLDLDKGTPLVPDLSVNSADALDAELSVGLGPEKTIRHDSTEFLLPGEAPTLDSAELHLPTIELPVVDSTANVTGTTDFFDLSNPSELEADIADAETYQNSPADLAAEFLSSEGDIAAAETKAESLIADEPIPENESSTIDSNALDSNVVDLGILETDSLEPTYLKAEDASFAEVFLDDSATERAVPEIQEDHIVSEALFEEEIEPEETEAEIAESGATVPETVELQIPELESPETENIQSESVELEELPLEERSLEEQLFEEQIEDQKPEFEASSAVPDTVTVESTAIETTENEETAEENVDLSAVFEPDGQISANQISANQITDRALEPDDLVPDELDSFRLNTAELQELNAATETATEAATEEDFLPLPSGSLTEGDRTQPSEPESADTEPEENTEADNFFQIQGAASNYDFSGISSSRQTSGQTSGQTSASTAEESIAYEYEESTEDTDTYEDLYEEEAEDSAYYLEDERHSNGHSDYEDVTLVDEEELERQRAQWEQQTKGNPLVIVGAFGFVLLGVLGFVFTRPCTVGGCDRIETAETKGNDAISSLQDASTLADVTEAKKELQHSIQMLEPIPLWSSHYEAAQAMLPGYEQQLVALDLVSEAQGKAYSAAVKSQDPPHPASVWEEVACEWREATSALSRVPEDSPVRSLAERKLVEYRANLSTILVRIETEAGAEVSLRQAQAAASQATQQAEQADSLEAWEVVLSNWDTAVENLRRIPQGTQAYGEAQSILPEYEEKRLEVRSRVEQERSASRVLFSAAQLSTEAESAEAEEQWSLSAEKWNLAIFQLREVPDTSLAHTEAQSRLATYTAKLDEAENNREVSLRFQPIEPSFYLICGANNVQVCTYNMKSGKVHMNIAAGYDSVINESITPPPQRTGIESDAQLISEGNRLLEQITLLSTQAQIPVELYDAEGTFLARYSPDLEGFVRQ